MNKTTTSRGMVILFSVCYAMLFLISSALLFGLEGTSLGIKPDLLLAMAVVCPVFCTGRASVVLALVFGLLTDISVTPPVHFSPVLFVLCAFFVPKISAVFSKNGAAESAVCGIPFALVRAVTGIFYLLSEYENARFSEILTSCVVPEFFCNLAAIIVVHFIMSALVKAFRLEHRQFL